MRLQLRSVEVAVYRRANERHLSDMRFTSAKPDISEQTDPVLSYRGRKKAWPSSCLD